MRVEGDTAWVRCEDGVERIGPNDGEREVGDYVKLIREPDGSVARLLDA